jgi:hypothetical protein
MASVAVASSASHFAITIAGESFLCRPLTREDGNQLLELHQLVFAAPLSMAWLEWKYLGRNSPSLGLWNTKGSLVAHCGGLARPLHLNGRLQAGLQICDVMVHPNWRAILSRRGPFYWISQQFYEQHIGSQRPYHLGYGFPSLRHLQLAQKLELLGDAGPVWELSWQATHSASHRHPWHWQAIELVEGSMQWQHQLQKAWSIMRAASSTLFLGDRSFAELDWRYRQHPHHKHFYTALKRPWSRTVSGVAIWRYTDSGSLLWLDWIGAPSDLARAQRMLARRLIAKPRAQLQTWGSEQIRMALRHTPGYAERLVARIGVPLASCLAQDQLDAHSWWWVAGDTDFL